MRVIICGAGQVGLSIAAYLAKEDNDVTIVDEPQNMIGHIADDLDVNVIAGFPSNPDVLNRAGASDADLLIAVTGSDEVNMVACQVGHSLFSIPKKIARIRAQGYRDPAWSNLFSRSHMPIDVIISPEILVAEDICRRLSVPGTTSVVSMADGKVRLIAVICMEDCPVLNTQFSQLGDLFPDLSFEVVFIQRGEKRIIPDGDDMLEAGDEAYIVLDNKHLRRVMAAFGHMEKEARSIVISGGGNIGYALVKTLREKLRGLQIKVIEQNEKRAKFLSETLEDIVVLQGDTLDGNLLNEASIDRAEAYVALMNNDESNILGSLLAKRYGCKRVLTLVNNNAYYPLVGPLGIDAMISPRSTIVSSIMQHVRRGRIRGIYNLRDGFSEVIEVEVSGASSVVNQKIGDLNLPREVVFGAIVRGDDVIMPEPDFELKIRDIVVVWATRERVRSVEKMFSVQVSMV